MLPRNWTGACEKNFRRALNPSMQVDLLFGWYQKPILSNRRCCFFASRLSERSSR